MELLSHLSGGIIGNDSTLFHHYNPVSGMIDILQPMLRDNDGGSQFDVDLTDSIQKIRCCNGIQLAGRLIQNQYLRLHRHNGRQIQKLLLTAGKGRYIFMKPALNTKIAGHFRHPQPHSLLIAAQRLQAESQLMPNLICDDLVIGILHHEADFCRLLRLIYLFQMLPVKAHLTASLTVRSQY